MLSSSKNLLSSSVNNIPSSSLKLSPKEDDDDDEMNEKIPSFSFHRKMSACSLSLSPPSQIESSTKQQHRRRFSSHSTSCNNTTIAAAAAALPCKESFLSKSKPTFELGLSAAASPYSSTNFLSVYSPSSAEFYRHSTSDLRSPTNNSDDEEEEYSSSDNSSSLHPKRKFVPSFFSGSFWSIFPGPEQATTSSSIFSAKSQKKSESLADVSKFSNFCFDKNNSGKKTGSRRNSSIICNSHPKRSRSSLPSDYLTTTPHPWSYNSNTTMNSVDDSDCSNDSSHTVIMVDKDSGVIYPKPQTLEAPRPIRMRSKSPRLGTIKSVESVEEQQQQSKPPLSLAARRNPSLSTVLEIPTTPCAEDAYQKEKCVIPYHRRMSALITTSDPNDDEDSRLNRRTSLKAPSLADGPLSPSADGWNAKAKIKYWKSRMSQQGQQMFRGGSSERRGSNLGLIPAITGFKRDIEGAGGSFRQRINSVGVLKNHSDKSPREPMPDALANVFSKNGKQSESGSEGIRTPGTGTGNHFFDETIPLPALKKPKWEDLDLWSNEPGSWSNCNSDVQLSASDKKRQNIIYELYMTEKNHVKVLVFLQQAYMVGLRQYNQASPFVTEEQLDKLIPDVLDSLLDFHLNLLRRLKKKKDENAIIETVSDIVEEEFGNGLFTTAAIRAYTIFCLSRDESCQIYAELMEKNPKFKKFFDHYEMQPAFKQHNFKSCFLLIAQRLTKYNLLFDSILKYDPIPQKAQSQRALTAVREFARRVDSELKKADINRQWDQLKSLLDKKSRGKILNRDFTYDDLVHQRMDDPRIVLAIGKVNYIASSVAQQTKDKIELTMVLFDDILVLFYLRNNSMHFYNSNMISSVIPLKTMIVREMERGTNEIMLLCTDKEKPDLYHLSFPSKSELRNWVTQIHSAKASAVAVRYAPGRRSQVTLQKHEEFNEEPHNSKIQEWQESLQILFDERKQKEELLRDYMVGRMKFFDEVRAHFKKFPIRSITASTSTLPVAGSLIERRETRDLEKIKNFVQQKFLELRETRRSGLDSLVERAEKARDYDLQSFFDDLHDLTIAISSSSESSGTDGGVETSTTSNSEDEPTSSSPLSSKGKKPRRVRTYHGSTADSSQPRGGNKEGSLRRHTTVPKLGESGVIRSDEDDEEEQIDESLRKLPLSMPNRARKAATALICENVNLRIENNKLKSENALQEMHISSLKSRKTAGIETEEKLESLRQKQEEIQARERKLKQDQENFKDEMRRKADDLDAREEKMKRREAEIESRMQYTQATFRSGSCVFQENEHHPPPPTPSIPTTSPTILSLAAKTQVKPKHRK